MACLAAGLLARAEVAPGPQDAVLLTFSGTVEVQPPTGGDYSAAHERQALHVGDKLRVGKNSRASLRMSDLSVLRVYESTVMEIKPPSKPAANRIIEIKSGAAYFFNRDKPQETEFQTPSASGAIRGTEFNLVVQEDGTTQLSLLDGEVVLANAEGSVDMHSGEQGTVQPGHAPQKTALIDAVNIIQWTLYYPAILDPDELEMDEGTRQTLAASLSAYRSGDLLDALAKYPGDQQGGPQSELVYHAALLLSVGRVDEAESILGGTSEKRASALAEALRGMIATVKKKGSARPPSPALASEWMAASYEAQGRLDLENALKAALAAAAKSPGFGFAWERVAELEFSFGRIHAAQRALDRALALSPRNAQGRALQGFLLLARDNNKAAQQAFNAAISIDPMLANAWLGRGLGTIHAGKLDAGLADLQTAAVLEPTRWVLRSYLGKAYGEMSSVAKGSEARKKWEGLAMKELTLAEQKDPLDPTPWLYSALILYNDYRIADAIADLEKSRQLNDNRQVYRSRLLLDQDQAVRSANLADIYKDAGMVDVSLNEASKAVSYDYANFSAHLNLASTYDELRDPTRFNLRYESEWFNETLLAGLLAPPGAISLSENLSQQEYSRLFQRDSIGMEGTTEFFSDKDYRQTASQYGSVDGLSWALDLYYQNAAGIRVNNQLEQTDWDSHIKQQITPEDSLYLFTTYEAYGAGDQFQYYNQSQASPTYHLTESQDPTVLAGWHHEWNPGSHTLFLAGRLDDSERLTDQTFPVFGATLHPTVTPGLVPFNVNYSNQFDVYTAELSQILERPNHTDIFGVRGQTGDFQATATLNNPPAIVGPFTSTTSTDTRFERISPYEYHHWEIVDGLMLIAGLTYDTEKYPLNYRRPPLDNSTAWKSQWSPKGALIWSPTPTLTLRGAFARALGGVSYDESVRLEPTQIAGFDQSFRSVISESLVGSVEAARYQVSGGAIDWRVRTNLWFTLQGQNIREQVGQQTGNLLLDFASATPSVSVQENATQLHFTENSFALTLNSIVQRDWFLQAQYKFTASDLRTTLGALPSPAGYNLSSSQSGSLNEARLGATWQPPSGIFLRGELAWFYQTLGGTGPQPQGDHFPALNLFAGYRFPNRRAELTVGLLNATGDNYNLSPINYYLDLPRQRLFYTRFRFNF
jgi:hypothetical protein